MKCRLGFVTNSSSTSFTITNKTDKDLTLVDFVKENPELVERFKKEYNWYADNGEYCQEQMIKDAEARMATGYDADIFKANSCDIYTYGDEDNDVLGNVFDYILRDGGASDSFRWKFYDFNR